MLPVWIVLFLLPIFGGAERFNCRGRILGAYYADAKSGCKAFHVCVRVAGGGIRDFRFFCPPGTLFHQEAQTCTDWGDDDPLACPADLYDGFDTKKVSSTGNRDDETEFGLQRAETGDRRLRTEQNNANGGAASDLRTAHSSDFFSGQRDRGRDDAPAPPSRPQSPPRQSFRRATTPRVLPTTTQYTTAPPPPSPQPTNLPQYDTASKRKLVRKRPIYVSTKAPTTIPQSTPQPQDFSQQQQFPQQQNFGSHQLQNNFAQQQQQFFSPQQQQQQNFNQRNPPQNRPTTLPPANVPPQYKDEYVEVPRVTPKHSRYFLSKSTQAPFLQSTPVSTLAPNKNDGLVELYNYDSQSTPGLNNQNDNRFKVRNSFSISDVPKETDFVRTRINTNPNNGRTKSTTADYNTAPSRSFVTSTPAYKNINSVSYEPEKNNLVPYSGAKQQYFNSPSTTPSTTTIYTTQRTDPPTNFNTVAYNTNNALNTVQPANYIEAEEDDGQYRPPRGEDDGQYRPELYETELLSGAHSLNIAASGNRLPDDQKPQKAQVFNQKPTSQTAAPRPFRPAPTPTTTRAPEPTYTTTFRAPTTTFRAPTTTFRAPTTTAQRAFDYFQTYTTTSRPSEFPLASDEFNFAPVNNAPARPTTTAAPRTPEPRPKSRAPAPPTLATQRPPSTRPPHFANPPSKKEDASYDYAYYDSDPGFTEYDHIEEFGRTKSKA